MQGNKYVKGHGHPGMQRRPIGSRHTVGNLHQIERGWLTADHPQFIHSGLTVAKYEHPHVTVFLGFFSGPESKGRGPDSVDEERSPCLS